MKSTRTAAVSFAALLAGWLVVTALPVQAMVRQMSFDEIVHAADLVFVGVVADQSCRSGADQQMIFTDVTFTIEEVYVHRAGSLPLDEATLVLSFAGGTIDDRHVRVSDVPSFDTGGRYLLFTKWDEIQHASPVIGFFQGRFDVVTDEATGTRYPLAAGRRPIVGLEDGHLAYGARTATILEGKSRPTAESVPDRRYEVPPRAAGESAEHDAWASAALDDTTGASEPLTLSELAVAIHRLAAVAASEAR